jgi:iron uptake system component EfeO
MKRWGMLAVAIFALAGCADPPTTSGSGSGTSETTEETTTASIANSPELERGTERYQEYVVEQSALLTERTELFTKAVIAGNVEEAKALYAPARVPWERIEPIAARLGDYDPNIDAREGDVPEDEWRGFHRIEQALWERNTTEGQEEYARQLQQDVEDLQGEISSLELEPVDLVTGSVELLNEVSASKITGEEERYSHTDLYDIQANVEGSEAAFEELKEPLGEVDPTLASNVEQRFDSVYTELEPYRRGEGWVSYEELDEDDRRELSQKIDALAEPLSQVGQVLG